jgi:hypothetical protein
MMQIFSRWPEFQARIVRWILLLGWMLLIISLFFPAFSLPEGMAPACANWIYRCESHRQPGNRLFWGVVVPSGLMVIVLLSHELWRRICPLAFASQLFRALGRQRTKVGKGGKPEVMKVSGDSWLGRNHIKLQWSLLIAGLSLRLLVVNSSPIGLAVLLLLTLAAAVIVGWAYGGKAWCQYVCPMGPVQTVLTGPRGPLGSTAHMGGSSKISQSMCRTIGESGREQSACVACQAPCLDIDAERHFWSNLTAKPGLEWAWYSYPGLVLSFFELLHRMVGGYTDYSADITYLRNGLWAYDATLPRRILEPIEPWLPIPNLLAVPIALSLGAALSVAIFRWLEGQLQKQYESHGKREPKALATSRCRLLSSFLAINCFFWFVDPSQGALGSHGGQVIRSLVLTVSAIWLFRGWQRDQATYRRESTSESLRKQLQNLPELDQALDGRSLEELSPQEVFTLAKALPAVGQQQSRNIYRGVITDMLRSGRLERATSLLQLQDLRQTLHLEDQDHHEAIRLLAQEEPSLLELDSRQRQINDLRQEAVAEALQELMETAGLSVLELENLSSSLRERIEQIRKTCGLSDENWQLALAQLGPQGKNALQRLQHQLDDWRQQKGLGATLALEAKQTPLIQPLALAMQLRCEALESFLKPKLLAAGWEPLSAEIQASGSLAEAFDLLWLDPDPDTAGWVLMVERQLFPETVAKRLQNPRQGFASSSFLEIQLSGAPHPDAAEFPFLASSPLFADLLPAGLVWVASQGEIHQWQPDDVVIKQGAISDGVGVVLAGEGRLISQNGSLVILGPGETLGEMGVITGMGRSRTVNAGPEGLKAFQLPTEAFEELLHRSRYFSRGLLRQLAQRLTATML